MRTYCTAFAAMAAGLIQVAIVNATPVDTTADAVVGQSAFDQKLVNQGNASCSATSLQEPQSPAIDPTTGRLWIADSLNNRVLSWPNAAAFTNGQAADIVLGQSDFTPNQANQGAANPTKKTLANPRGLTFDAAGRLYVADTDNVRVLRFDPPISSTTDPSQVFGQGGDFTKNDPPSVLNVTADRLGNPLDVAVDSNGTLYVVDRFFHRVSIYNSPVTTDTTADLVLGQPDLNTTGFNRGGNPAANSLAMPFGEAIDANNNLYIADLGNNRILQFRAPITNDKSASRVFGQPDFTTTNSNSGGISASTMLGPVDAAVDLLSGHLFVADATNSRILEFNDPLGSTSGGPAANRVFGQGGAFNTGDANKGGVSANSLNDVVGMTLDSSGNFYVADRLNHRVLRYNALPVADLEIAISDAPDPVTVNTSLTYTVTLTNHGPGVANAVVVTLNLGIPATSTDFQLGAGGSGCSGNTCNIGSLASGASVTGTIVVTPSATGTLNSSVSVATSSNDLTTGNNMATAQTTVADAAGNGGNGGGGNDGGGNNGGQDGGNGNVNPACGGPAGMTGCGGAGLLPLTLIGLGGLKAGRRTRRK